MLLSLVSCRSTSVAPASIADAREMFTMPGCGPIQKEDRDQIEHLAVIHFKSEIGVPVIEHELLEAVDCDRYFVVPVQALVIGSPFPRVWFVEIDKRDRNRITLMRPE